MPRSVAVPDAGCYADLRGKVAVVTGGGTRIGRGICVRLAREGMQVIFCGRTEARLDVTRKVIESEGGVCIPCVADITTDDGIATIERAVTEQGGVGLMVHNAALMPRGTVESTGLEQWRQVFRTNSEAAFRLVRLAAHWMAPEQAGSIVLISTIGALQAHHGMVAYDASKGAIEALTRAAALDLAPLNIRVNSIAPGSIRERPTSLPQGSVGAVLDELGFSAPTDPECFSQEHVPMQRHGTCAEIAAAVSFLGSTQSSYITGHTLVVDGGATAQLSPRMARI